MQKYEAKYSYPQIVRLNLEQIELEGLLRFCKEEHWSDLYLRKPYTKRNCQLANQLYYASTSLNCSFNATVKVVEGQTIKLEVLLTKEV